MILRTIALLFAAAAVVMGFAFGWSWPLGNALAKVNLQALQAMEVGVHRTLWPGAWDSLIAPLLSVPSWSAPAALALVMFGISSFRPGHH